MKSMRTLLCLAGCSLMLTAAPSFAQSGGTNSSATEQTQNQSSGTNTGNDTTMRSGGDTSTDSPTGSSNDPGAKAAHKSMPGEAPTDSNHGDVRDMHDRRDTRMGKMGEWQDSVAMGKIVDLSSYMGDGKEDQADLSATGKTLGLVTEDGMVMMLIMDDNTGKTIMDSMKTTGDKPVILKGKKIMRGGLCAFKATGTGTETEMMDMKNSMKKHHKEMMSKDAKPETDPNIGGNTTK